MRRLARAVVVGLAGASSAAVVAILLCLALAPAEVTAWPAVLWAALVAGLAIAVAGAGLAIAVAGAGA